MTTPETKTTTQKPEKKRAQLSHALIDVDFNSKPQIKTLELKFGPLARLWYLDITLDLSRATNAEIDLDLALAMAEALGIKDPGALLQFCTERGLLVHTRTGFISSWRVIEDQESLAEKREKWRRAKTDSNETLDRSSPDSQKSVNVQKSEDLNTEDLKSNKMDFPKSLDTLEHKAAILKWVNYSQKKHRKFISEMELEALLLNWSSRANELIPAINQSIERGWKGIIYKPPDEKPQKGHLPGTTAVTVSMETSMHPAAVAERRRIQKAKEKIPNV